MRSSGNDESCSGPGGVRRAVEEVVVDVLAELLHRVLRERGRDGLHRLREDLGEVLCAHLATMAIENREDSTKLASPNGAAAPGPPGDHHGTVRILHAVSQPHHRGGLTPQSPHRGCRGRPTFPGPLHKLACEPLSRQGGEKWRPRRSRGHRGYRCPSPSGGSGGGGSGSGGVGCRRCGHPPLMLRLLSGRGRRSGAFRPLVGVAWGMAGVAASGLARSGGASEGEHRGGDGRGDGLRSAGSGAVAGHSAQGGAWGKGGGSGVPPQAPGGGLGGRGEEPTERSGGDMAGEPGVNPQHLGSY
eukprot:RCo039299